MVAKSKTEKDYYLQWLQNPKLKKIVAREGRNLKKMKTIVDCKGCKFKIQKQL